MGQRFADAMENVQDDRTYAKMVQVLHTVWNSRPARNSVAMKIWYHNTAARAWEAFLAGEPRERLPSPKDRLLDWESPK
jgi:hypothetical protein